MKCLLKYLGTYLRNVCLIFTCCATGFALYALLDGAMFLEAVDIMMILAVSVVIALFQTLCFTDVLFERMSYLWRTALFLPLCLMTVVGRMVLYGWSLPEIWRVFGKFMFIFLVLFAALLCISEISFRLQGKKYDRLLGRQLKREES